MFFKSEVKCEKCGISVPRKQIGDFDTTHQGRRKHGDRFRLCNSYMLSTITEYFTSFEERAVVIHPSASYNTYVFYQFDELLSSSRHSVYKSSDIEFINGVKELLPPEQAQCDCCCNTALFTWIPLDVFDKDPFSWQVNKWPKSSWSYFCKKCLSNAFSEKVREENVVFRSIYPPIKGEGFCTPWEV